MIIVDWIVNYRRFLKRKNYSIHTVKNYLNSLKGFALWLDEPIEAVTYKKILAYVDDLQQRGVCARTINCHLIRIRGFYDYLTDEEGIELINPVKRGFRLRLAKPLPRHLKDPQVEKFFGVIKSLRDRAIFKVMLRCGLRVEEVSNLCLSDLDLRRQRVLVENGKGAKGRVVYVSRDAHEALVGYLKVRAKSRAKGVFLVEKGPFKGKPISVRGIQKRMEYYGRKSGLKISCHQLRHTMATQMLNADAELETIQDLLGHSRITTTQRYCRLSNEKVRKDYFKTMEVLLQKAISEGTTKG